MKEISVIELLELRKSGQEFQLIDVRETYEYDVGNIDGVHIPMGEIPLNIERIHRNGTVIIHCRSGARSANVIRWLEAEHGFTNLYNLSGGIMAWKNHIDPSVEV